MRRAAKIDANQPDIVLGLRLIGATVQPLHAVGKGCPDLLVGYRGVNYLIEVKDGRKPRYDTNLTDDQVKWHSDWRGQNGVVYSLDDALVLIGAAVEVADR